MKQIIMKHYVTRGFCYSSARNQPILSSKIEFWGFDEQAKEIHDLCQIAWPCLSVKTSVLEMKKCKDGKERPHVTKVFND